MTGLAQARLVPTQAEGAMYDGRFRGRDFITILDYTREEVLSILDVAADLKQKFSDNFTNQRRLNFAQPFDKHLNILAG